MKFANARDDALRGPTTTDTSRALGRSQCEALLTERKAVRARAPIVRKEGDF